MTEYIIVANPNNQSSILSSMIPVIAWWMITLFWSFLAHFFGFYFEKKSKKTIERQKLFSELNWIRLSRHQFVYFFWEATIYSNYHEYLYKIKNNDIDLNEALRWMRKAEDFAIEITKTHQLLLEKLWLISIHFKEIPWIYDLIKDVKLNSIKISPPSEITLEWLEKYKIDWCAQLNSLIQETDSNKLEKILDKMQGELSK